MSKAEESRGQRAIAFADAAKPGRVRDLVAGVYARAAADWKTAPSVLAVAGRNELGRSLHSTERRFANEALYGMIRLRRRLEFALSLREVPAAVDARKRLAHADQLFLTWLYLHAPLEECEAIGVELQRVAVRPETLESAKARLITRDNATEELAVWQSYPSWFTALVIEQFGVAEATALLTAMNQRAPLYARANLLVQSREALVVALAREYVVADPQADLPAALELKTHLNAYGLQSFRAGGFELQDVGSQWIAEVTAPPPGARVVDACAGAGGKTLALGALLQNRGRILALDIGERKLRELKERGRRAQLTNITVQLVDPVAPKLPADWLGQADRVLCDAPCSGSGVFRRNPEAKWRMEPAQLDELERLQKSILQKYAPFVKVGGRLIYATCSVLARENEAIVADFLATQPAFELVSIKEILGGARAGNRLDGPFLRLLPHRHNTDGFFAAVMRRKS